jgi:MFS family permease
MAAEATRAKADEGTWARYRSALRSRDLRTLIVAFFVDGAASWAYIVVLMAYIFERTHSTGWITALVTAKWIVGMLAGGYGGVLADRFDRRRVLMVSAVTSIVVMVGIAVIVGTDAPLWLLLAVSCVGTAVYTPVRPASGALIPEVVPESDLVAANAIFSLLESVIAVIGPGVGALLMLTGDPVYGVLINAASFLVSASLYAILRIRSHGSAEPGGNAFKQWGAGMRSLIQHRRAFVLVLFLVLDSAAINAANVLMPALSNHLHGGGSGYSLLIAAGALGGVVVAGIANKLAGSSRITMIITGAMFLECVPLWVSVTVGSVPPALVLELLAGVGMVIVDVLAFTAVQRSLPRDVLGRVLGTLDVLILGACVLASVLASALYSAFGIGWALAVIGLGIPVLGLAGLPMLRGVDAEAARTQARLEPHISLLESLDLFTGARRSLLEHLADCAEEHTLPAGERIIVQGDQPDALWILADGQLAVSAIRDDGVPVDLPPVDAPGYVGELGLMNHAVRSATVTTAVECRLLRIPGEDFVAALETAQPSSTMLGRAGVRTARTAVTAVPSTTVAAD